MLGELTQVWFVTLTQLNTAFTHLFKHYNSHSEKEKENLSFSPYYSTLI